MSELPAGAWIGVGLLVGGMSLYIGFINPVTRSGFFQLMTVVGAGMIGFGYLKIKMKGSKTQRAEDMIQQKKMQGSRYGQMEVDIDHTRQNPGHHHPMQHQNQGNYQAHQQHHPQHMQHHSQPAHQQRHPAKNLSPTMQKAGVSGYCSQCGTPLLKHHKFCPICGARV